MIIFISGKSASGKDTLMQRFLQLHPEVESIVYATTRDKRKGEFNGKDYFFKTYQEYMEDKDNDRIIEERVYTISGDRMVYYYTPIYSIKPDTDYIVVGPPTMLKNYINYFGKDVIFPFGIEVAGFTRIQRSFLRLKHKEDDLECAEICRRFLSDEIDYAKEILSECGIDEMNTFSNDFPDSMDTIVDILDKWYSTSK